MDGFGLFGRLLEQHPIDGLALDGGQWRRLLACIDRQNHDPRTPEDCKLDPEDPEDITLAVLCLVEGGLEMAEAESGLAGTLWGDILSREQVDEAARRRAEKRARGRGDGAS